MIVLDENKLLMMIRDRGHATTIEITIEGTKAKVDYFIPGIVSLILLQIFPIIWSIIIAIFYYIGIRCRSKCCRKISRFFMF